MKDKAEEEIEDALTRIAYVAYYRHLMGIVPPAEIVIPWLVLTPIEQDAWKAAALAVRTQVKLDALNFI